MPASGKFVFHFVFLPFNLYRWLDKWRNASALNDSKSSRLAPTSTGYVSCLSTCHDLMVRFSALFRSHSNSAFNFRQPEFTRTQRRIGAKAAQRNMRSHNSTLFFFFFFFFVEEKCHIHMGVDAVPALFRVSGGGQHKYAMRCLTLTCTPMKRGVLFFSESGTANPKCGKLAVFHCPPC